MLKKITIIVMFIMIVISMTACNNNAAREEYSDEQIVFTYPASWEPDISGSFNVKTIILNQDQDEFDFVIEIKERESSLTREEWLEKIEKELYNSFIKIAEDMVSIEIVQIENTEVDDLPARKLKREIIVLDSQIERLYFILAENLQVTEEIDDYLSKYEDINGFISAVKDDYTELHELQKIVATLKGRNSERNQNLMLADNFIDNIIMLKEDSEDNSDVLFYDYVIKTGNDNCDISIYYQAYENNFFANLETIEEVIESIEIK